MKIKLATEQDTEQFAGDLAICLQKGDFIALSGELGAGKTTLARALIRALAGDPRLEVPSPTFTLLQSYETPRFALAHADFYRLTAEEEAEELGLEEILEDGIAIAEWAEKAPALRKRANFKLELSETEGNARLLSIAAAPQALARLEHSLAIRAFLRSHGRGAAKRRFLQGDASARRYEALLLPAPKSEADSAAKTEILMDAPLSDAPNPARALYLKQAHLAESNSQFCAIDRLLRAEGFTAPQIYAQNPQATLLLLEDLGAEGIITPEGQPNAKRYLACAEFLAKFHQTDWVKAAKAARARLPHYSAAALQAEADLLAQWHYPRKHGKPAPKAWRAEYHRLWQKLFAKTEQEPPVLVLRDFHSPNILWQSRRAGIKRIGLIDFQDANLGAPAYDLVSLAQDARIAIPPALERLLAEAYSTARALFEAEFSAEQFAESYAILGAQRACKILGVFVRLAEQDGKSGYLRHLPRMADYLQRNLQHPALRDIKTFLAESGMAE